MPLDKTLLKVRLYYEDKEVVKNYIEQLRKSGEYSESEIARTEKTALAGVEARRAKSINEVRGIFADRIKQAKDSQNLNPKNVGAVNDVVKLVESLGDASAVQINNVLQPLRGDNAALNTVREALRTSGKIKHETLHGIDFGLDLGLEVGRHQAMEKICLEALQSESERGRLEFAVATKMFAANLGYGSEE